jgi:hypothetical protein
MATLVANIKELTSPYGRALKQIEEEGNQDGAMLEANYNTTIS